MAVKPIFQCTVPAENELLRQESIDVPVELFNTPELKQIIQDMIDTLDTQSDGVALAAPQIGILYRIFVVRYDRTLPTPLGSTDASVDGASQVKIPAAERKADIGVFINPQFIKSSRRREEMDEGCLSVRGIYGTTYRHDRATVRAQTETGAFFERGGGGLLAQIFQHETDHLEGILFIDHAIELTAPKVESDSSTNNTKHLPNELEAMTDTIDA